MSVARIRPYSWRNTCSIVCAVGSATGRMPPSGLAVPERAQFDGSALCVGHFASPHDGVVEVFTVEDQDPTKLLAGFGKGPVSNQGFTLAHPHARGGCGRLQASAGAQHSGVGHIPIESAPGLV